MSAITNVFARCSTVDELDTEFDFRTSPEVISWDGERDLDSVRLERDGLARQYNERFAQLLGLAAA